MAISYVTLCTIAPYYSASSLEVGKGLLCPFAISAIACAYMQIDPGMRSLCTCTYTTSMDSSFSFQ